MQTEGFDQITKDIANKAVDDVLAALIRNTALTDTADDYQYVSLRVLMAVLVAVSAVFQAHHEERKVGGERATGAEQLAWTLAALRLKAQGGFAAEAYKAAQRDVSLLLANGFPLPETSECMCGRCTKGAVGHA